MTPESPKGSNLSNHINPMIYGQFIEHFHRQIYGGVYDPSSSFADEDGFRTDVIEAMKAIKVPILRWPGGCFVSAYHWKNGVGSKRHPMFDKAWRVEDPNSFGTDEYIKLCRKVGCAPYICTNAGTGTSEEMSDWVEYCNLKDCGSYSRERSDNGHPDPYNVRYWSIGNENYGPWEIGAKTANEWGHLVCESAKMMKRVDPSIELSAAALDDMDWNRSLLKACGQRLSWISLHGYWDFHQGKNILEDYDTCMKYTDKLEEPVTRVRGLLKELGCEHIKIAYDEWNLRAWYHPNIMDIYQGRTPEEYLYPRNDNDINSQYTMADAVFTACFLNMCIRNCDIIGMANFSPVVNTRGMIFTHKDGIVLRSTYYVFKAYTEYMRDYYSGTQLAEIDRHFPSVDYVVSSDESGCSIAIALINKDAFREAAFELSASALLPYPNASFDNAVCSLYTVNGPCADSYNDIDKCDIRLNEENLPLLSGTGSDTIAVTLKAHSVNILTVTFKSA